MLTKKKQKQKQFLVFPIRYKTVYVKGKDAIRLNAETKT